MSDHPRYIGGDEFPPRPRRFDRAAEDRWLAASYEAALTGHYDPEWSTEQTFAGEFGTFNGFGDPID
jgi:hypothetical protein